MNGNHGAMRCLLATLALLAAGACVTTTPTREASVLSAVEEIRIALAGNDADAVWELLSTRHRNLYEEVRRTRAGIEDTPTADSPWPLDFGEIGVEVLREDAAKMTAREFHRALFVPATRPPVGDGAVVRTHDEWTEVDDVEHGYRWWLRREGDEWKVAILLTPDTYGAGLQIHTCASGREIILAVTVELRRKKVHEVPLPVVPRDAALEEEFPEFRVALDLDRRTAFRGEFLDDTELLERFCLHAERKRDMEHPAQPSVIPFLLAVHRELTWRRVEEVLWLLADDDVRVWNVLFLTSEYPAERRGIPVDLHSRARLTTVRHAVPAVRVRIGTDAAMPARLAGLATALAALPEAKFEKGIRTIVSPDLPVGEALAALAVVGRCGEIVHVLAKEPFEGLTLDGSSVEPVEEAAPAPVPGTLRLTLVLRLPPGATTPTNLFRRLLLALDNDDTPALRDLLARSIRAEPEEDSAWPWRKAKGTTLKEVTVDGDRATVSYDGPQVLGVLYLVREDGRWYLAPEPSGPTPR